jgi:hypothetical protein
MDVKEANRMARSQIFVLRYERKVPMASRSVNFCFTTSGMSRTAIITCGHIFLGTEISGKALGTSI